MKRQAWSAVLLVSMLAGVAVAGSTAPAPVKKKLTLERLYSYPKLEGTAPVQAKWSADGKKLAFLWNDSGMPFRDLWVYDAERGKRIRLTELDQPRDQWTTTPAYEDPKLKPYLPPETGLSDFEWAPDAQKLAFAFRGELYVVPADGGAPPLRLTKTKDPEFRPKFSPDSTRLAFSSEQELWVVDLRTGQRTQLTSGGSDDVLNGAPPFPESDARTFEWSPDGQWIAFLQTDRTGEPTRLIPNYSGTEVSVRKQRRTYAKDETPKIRLGVVPAAGGKPVWLTAAARQYYTDWQWSPDSSAIVLTRVEENWKQRHLDVVDVVGAIKEAKEAGEAEEAKEKKPAEGAERFPWVRTIYSESDEKWICTACAPVEWSPDGQWILFLSEMSGWNHLYLIRAAGEAVASGPSIPQARLGTQAGLGASSARQLTSGTWEVETRGFPLEMRPRFSPDGQWVYFTANKEDLSARDFYRVGLGGGEPQRLTSRVGYNAVTVSPGGQRLALLFSSFAQPWDLYVKPMAGSGAASDWRRVTESPLKEFDEYEWPQPKIVEFPGRDKKTVRALLFAPTELAVHLEKIIRLPGPAPQRPTKPAPPQVEKVPVVNFVHGAGYAQAVLNRWGGYSTERFQFNQFLAQHGYAVIDVDYRGSSGYGRDWRTDVYLYLGGKDLEDELAAMDYLKTVPYVDTERAGIWGVSYGGFMTLMALFRSPDTFKAGSAWAAVTDWENYNRHYTQQRLRTPKEEPEAYQRSSPIHHVAGLKGALQIQHGLVDDNVHFQDAAQLLDALVAAGKEFDLAIYPQSSHGWSHPQVWLHSTQKLFDFFERHLKPN